MMPKQFVREQGKESKINCMCKGVGFDVTQSVKKFIRGVEIEK